MNTLFKLSKSVLRILTLFYILLLIGMYILQDKILFQPSKENLSDCRGVINLNGSVEEVSVGDENIRFIHIKNNEAKKTMIVFHGNAGSACHRLDLAYKLKGSNINFIFYEYPGYAGNDDEISEQSILGNALKFTSHLDSQGLIIGDEIIFGESLGTAVATFVASKREKAQKLILQSPYTSMIDVASSQYPYLPVALLLKNKFDTSNFVSSVKAQTVFICGENDPVIPLAISQEQFKKFRTEKKMIIYNGKAHNDIRYSNPKFWSDLKEVLK